MVSSKPRAPLDDSAVLGVDALNVRAPTNVPLICADWQSA